jgi:hypothetical protein
MATPSMANEPLAIEGVAIETPKSVKVKKLP